MLQDLAAQVVIPHLAQSQPTVVDMADHTVTVVQEQEPVVAGQAEMAEQAVQVVTVKALLAAHILPVAHPTIWVQAVAVLAALAAM
jgi:hypothetical protein